MTGGGFAAAHLPGAPRRLRGRSSGLQGASRFLRTWPPATLDPGDLGGPWVRKSGQARACPWPGARRAGPAVADDCGTRTPGNKMNWRSINKEGGNYTNPGPGTGPVTSSQQSHLAKLRHTELGVHETRDAPKSWRACAKYLPICTAIGDQTDHGPAHLYRDDLCATSPDDALSPHFGYRLFTLISGPGLFPDSGVATRSVRAHHSPRTGRSPKMFTGTDEKEAAWLWKTGFEIVSVVEETYGLVGRVLSTDVPGAVYPGIRPDIMEQVRTAEVDPLVTDAEMLSLLRTAYFDLVETVILLRGQLLGTAGEKLRRAAPAGSADE